MYDFIEDDDEPAYTNGDVLACDQVLTAFINDVAASEERFNYSWVVAKVEGLVKSLNEMNLKHDNQLIETNQREDLCALIELVVLASGHAYKHDITEAWREW